MAVVLKTTIQKCIGSSNLSSSAMDKLKEYLKKEFIYNTVPKYYKYFEEWFNSLTKNQLVYYTAYMNGCKTPY